MWPTRNNRPRCPRAKKANNTIAKEKTFSVFITQRLEPYTACVRTTWSLTQSEGSLINNGIEIIGLQRLIIIRSWIGEGHKQTFRIRLTGKKGETKIACNHATERIFQKNCWVQNTRAKIETYPHMPPAVQQLFGMSKEKKRDLETERKGEIITQTHAGHFYNPFFC